MAKFSLFNSSSSPLKPSQLFLRTANSVSYPAKSIQSAIAAAVATMSDDDNRSFLHHPSLEILGGSTEKFLPQLKTLNKAYTPFPIIGWNRHVETIFASLFRSLPDVKYRRECVRMKDSGVVSLDWVAGDDKKLSADSPVLILLPGLTGGSQDAYVRHMLIKARSNGWRVVVFNSRGCGNSPVITPQFYSASFMGDMREVVSHVGKRYTTAKLYAVGWSLGANILVRYLGQSANKAISPAWVWPEELTQSIFSSQMRVPLDADSCKLTGAVSLCNPFNLVIADEDFRKGFNIIYDQNLSKALCKIYKKHAPLFEDIGGEYRLSAAANPKSVRDFDDGLTRVSFGFKSVDDYYSKSSSSDSIKHVRTPLLCIQAENDPIAPSRGIPREDIKENPNCMLIVTPKGGHLGWVAGSEAPLGAPWTDTVVMDFLEYLRRTPNDSRPSSKSDDNVLEQHTNELQKKSA